MIGGPRSTVTDAQGAYRFTQLPSGEYRVSFALQGFQTLNIEGVRVTIGSTMTINGTLGIDTVSESITVTSETPTIDLQATTVGVNWDQKQMDDLPYGRGVRGLARLVPGLSPTQFDVGGNTVGGSTTTGARSYGRTGGELSSLTASFGISSSGTTTPTIRYRWRRPRRAPTSRAPV